MIQSTHKPTAGSTTAVSWPVATDVAGVTLSIVNTYLIGRRGAEDREWVLVDAGLAGSADRIRAAAAERFARHARPAAILLTHGHFDHVGALSELAEGWDAPIFCHRHELPYLTGQASYPPPDASVSGLTAFCSRFFPSGPFQFGARVQHLPDDGTVPVLPDWRWIPTPGHAPGHVSFFRERDRALIAGDAFVTVPQESALAPFLRTPTVHRPPAYFTPDWSTARKSVQRLRDLEPHVAATGHGPVIRGNALVAGLEHLIERWDELAVPQGGRYSRVPARFRPDGTAIAPPPVLDLRLVGLGIIAGLSLANTFRHRAPV